MTDNAPGLLPVYAGSSPETFIEIPDTDLMAQVLYSPWWCRPVFVNGPGDVPPDTLCLLWKQDGLYCFLLALSIEASASLAGARGGVLLKAEGAGSLPAALLSRDADPYRAAENAFRKAAELAGIPVREQKQLPDFARYLGWCTWDAMEIWVSRQGIEDKLREFREKKAPVRWALIDDMWARVRWTRRLSPFTEHSVSFPVMHSSALLDLEGDPERFPGGMAECIKAIHEAGFWAGLWFPVTGYWAGLAEGSPALEFLGGYVKKYGGRYLPDLESPEAAEGFYGRLCARLKETGADFIKADNQSFLRTGAAGKERLPARSRNLNRGLDRAADRYFGGALINCMGMAGENMLARRSAVCRCSNDFQPENSKWFAEHLLQCAFAGLTQGQLYFNDWDMWWTDDSQAVKNSVLRAVSGGPVYVSDKAGRTRPEILRPLCLEDGRLLMCDAPAVPVKDCLLRDPAAGDRAFGVFSRQKDAVYIAAFNLTGRREAGIYIDPAEYGIEGPSVLYEHFTGTKAEGPLEFAVRDCALFLLAPVAGGRRCLGIREKYISTAAVIEGPEGIKPLCPGTLLWYENGVWREEEAQEG